MGTLHQSHPAIIKRLKRCEGHLHKIIAMMEDGRPCTELAQQLYAVERAVRAAKSTLIHDHVDHCLAEAVTGAEDARDRLAEFKEITRYL